MMCHANQHLTLSVENASPTLICFPGVLTLINMDKLHRRIMLPCHANYLDHADSSSVVVRLHTLCVPAFASSRIGSRSVVVRYDEFSDKFFCSFSQASPPLHLFYFYMLFWSIAILMLRFCCVTCPIHLLPIFPRYTSSPYLLFVVCQLCES